jgi:hypothetical protein
MKTFNHKVYEAQKTLSDEYEYPKWRREIPFIELPEGYLFKPIPNFTGSVVRFLAKKKGEEKVVSIYLDCYEELGLFSFGEDNEPIPYWELYPTQDGDNFRCEMNEVDKLVQAIVEALEDK